MMLHVMLMFRTKTKTFAKERQIFGSNWAILFQVGPQYRPLNYQGNIPNKDQIRNHKFPGTYGGRIYWECPTWVRFVILLFQDFITPDNYIRGPAQLSRTSPQTGGKSIYLGKQAWLRESYSHLCSVLFQCEKTTKIGLQTGFSGPHKTWCLAIC